MDVCEAVEILQRKREVDSKKQSSRNNERLTRPSRTTYTSPTPSVSRRCVSPNAARTAKGSSAQTSAKRAFSADRRTKLPDLLRPSTMHSLMCDPLPSVSAIKDEKPTDHALSEGTLKVSSNIKHKSPLRGKNSENSRPDSIGTSSGVVLFPTIGISSLRRLSADGIPRLSHVNRSAYRGHALIDEITKTSLNMKAVDDSLLKFSMLHKQNLNRTSEKLFPGSRVPSPNKASGTSPRPSQKTSSAVSVLGYLCDLKKGKKSVSQMEDAHSLRLLYNRYIQWRFANAKADAAMRVQRILAEEALYDVWKATLELSDSVIIKKTGLQQLRLELKLNTLLKDQLAYLEDWELLERDHSIALAGAIKDLELTTLRLHLTGGATADVVSLNAALGSAVAVMQGMTSSISYVLSKVEATGCLVSELAELAAVEMAMLDDCQAILASTASMQEEEYSLRAQLTQHLQNYKKRHYTI